MSLNIIIDILMDIRSVIIDLVRIVRRGIELWRRRDGVVGRRRDGRRGRVQGQGRVLRLPVVGADVHEDDELIEAMSRMSLD